MNTDRPVIEVAHLTKKFGDFVAVDNLQISVKPGEVFGFLGANGAGKTTAIKMLCGLLKPTSGDGTVAGFDILHENEKIKKRIGYMMQKFSLYAELTVAENMRLFGGIYGMSRHAIGVRTRQLLDLLDFSQLGNTRVQSLPLGWKQKLAFAVAIFHHPEIVFLDEPTGGVDPITRRRFWELILESAAKGYTVFITTHYMDEAEYCDRVSIMVDGQIKALDSPANLKRSFKAKNMDEVFRSLARNAQRQ